MSKTLFCVLLYSLVVVVAGVAQPVTFPPPSDLKTNATLTAFVDKLKTAVAARDADYLISVLDHRVVSSFDGNNDVGSFKTNWGLDNDATYMWRCLDRIMNLGGAFVNDPNDESGRYTVVFPYTYNFEPAEEDDYFSLGCVTGKTVNLREMPTTKSKVITQLSHHVIFYVSDDMSGPITSGENEFGEPEWYRIETYDHQYAGWIHWKYVYPAMGARLFLFEKTPGHWLISAFLIGD